MDERQKRKHDQMEQSSIEQVYEYQYSASDHRMLKKVAAKRSKFTADRRMVLVDNLVNYELDINTKMAAVKASAFVVSLVSFSGELALSQSCGTIIETDENNNIVMTSLNLVRQPATDDYVQNKLAKNLKIVVRSSDEKSYLGEIVTYDYHYNLLFVKFKSTTALQFAKLRMLDDHLVIDKSFGLRPHSLKVKHDDPVIVVGKYFYKSFDFMAAPGIFSKERWCAERYDCVELLSSSCNISSCGDGAPLINLLGEVIGIAYYDLGPIAPFLPINIASKIWDHYKKYKEIRHPYYGFEASSLYLADLPTIVRVMTRFPSTCNGGLMVEKVQPGSCAESAGLLKKDVIRKCNGKIVKSFLELWGLMWDKVGQDVKLEVARVGLPTLLTISMMVGEATPDELNKWPQNGYC